MDFFIGLLIGMVCGGLHGFFVAALMIANGREVEPEPDGVDDVLDELFKTVQNQPKTVHDEEEKAKEIRRANEEMPKGKRGRVNEH